MSKPCRVILAILLSSVLIMSQLLPAKAESDGEPPQGLITNSSDNAITFEVEVPVEDILVETIEVEN